MKNVIHRLKSAIRKTVKQTKESTIDSFVKKRLYEDMLITAKHNINILESSYRNPLHLQQLNMNYWPNEIEDVLHDFFSKEVKRLELIVEANKEITEK
jgi:hypothetical protein